LKSEHNPLFLNYLDIPMVYSQGNPWRAKVIPLSTDVPFIVKTFFMTFDIYKLSVVNLNKISNIDLETLVVDFYNLTNHFSLVVEMFFDYSV
jgi:hypothetical protein